MMSLLQFGVNGEEIPKAIIYKSTDVWVWVGKEEVGKYSMFYIYWSGLVEFTLEYLRNRNDIWTIITLW